MPSDLGWYDTMVDFHRDRTTLDPVLLDVVIANPNLKVRSMLNNQDLEIGSPPPTQPDVILYAKMTDDGVIFMINNTTQDAYIFEIEFFTGHEYLEDIRGLL